MLIKFIYTLFLALLVALFVGLGINTFYSGPKAPQYPVELEGVESCCEQTAEQTKIRADFDQAQRKYGEEMKPYSRNVSIISLAASIIILIISLTLLARIKMIADGILLGGVFTTFYGIIQGLIGGSSYFRFLIVVVGLIIALALGYIKFIRPKDDLQQN